MVIKPRSPRFCHAIIDYKRSGFKTLSLLKVVDMGKHHMFDDYDSEVMSLSKAGGNGSNSCEMSNV